MTVEKLKRVMLRLRSRMLEGQTTTNQIELRRAIMIECGTTPATVCHNRQALVRLGWIKNDKNKCRLTGKDLTEDYF